MWTATLLEFNKDYGRVYLLVEYTDGTDTHTRSYTLENPTKKSIRNLVREEATRFQEVKDNAIDLPVGASIDITIDPPSVPPTPTPAQAAKIAWLADWLQLKRLTEVVDTLPVLQTAQSTTLIATLRARLEAGWLNSYLGSI